MTKRQQNAADKRINSAYCASCSGIQINIMDTVKVMAHGRVLVAQGADDAALRSGLRAFVTIL